MIILDEHLQRPGLEAAISRWYKGKVFNVKQLRPETLIKDDAVPALLRRVKQPTFVTINASDFWRRVSADQRYCIVCLHLSKERTSDILELLRRLFQLPGFRTKAQRMGKVALVSQQQIQYYQRHDGRIYRINWPEGQRRL